MFHSTIRANTRPLDAARRTFAPTQFIHSEQEDDYTGFAPTELMRFEAPPAAQVARIGSRRRLLEADVATALAAERAVARAAASSRPRPAAAQPQRATDVPAPMPTAPRGWLARLEGALERVLPGPLGSLLQLFICVSLSMALLSAMLPMIDRV